MKQTSKRATSIGLVIFVLAVSSIMSCSIFGEAGMASVDLKTADDFVILAKSGISTVPASDITGDVGLSPAATTFLTGFSQTDATGYATSTQVTGKLYVADMADPTPMKLTTAVVDMQEAYTDAATRLLPDKLNEGGGTIDGLTLAPGLYKWDTTVVLNNKVTLRGGMSDLWIFQIAGGLTVGSTAEVDLSFFAQPENVIWQVAGVTVLGANSDFKGIILGNMQITMQNGAKLKGRALSQSAVSMDQSIVTKP